MGEIKLKRFGLFGPKKVKWSEFRKKLKEAYQKACDDADLHLINLQWKREPNENGFYELRALVTDGIIDKAYADDIIDESSLYYPAYATKQKVTDDTVMPDNIQKAMLEKATKDEVLGYVKKLIEWNRRSGNRTTPK
jgi:TRAP-type mannitol/chloroaromatic compound transport system substrate-binding protein